MNVPGLTDADLRSMEDLDLVRTIRASTAYQDSLIFALCTRLENAVEYTEELEANAKRAAEDADEDIANLEARVTELQEDIADLKRQLEDKT